MNKKIPKFSAKGGSTSGGKKEDEERAFWSKFSLEKNFKPDDFENASFPNLKPSSQPISLRLPSHLLARIKEHANELDVPYQLTNEKIYSAGYFDGSLSNI